MLPMPRLKRENLSQIIYKSEPPLLRRHGQVSEATKFCAAHLMTVRHLWSVANSDHIGQLVCLPARFPAIFAHCLNLHGLGCPYLGTSSTKFCFEKIHL
ncbi:hypothetical protein K450DRAFT_228492 [Umbelopsis ramanniana AG]|uniref:Uncharacterized protein n=1 Tax=Umbelopsis ramanniana AG TaxID=1314678 RepID=A0AAD5HFD7_UMBRA|nr:uncharacterized protein K450DRAFT_228492 [Umbelopsis ramanniana AG]KAI8582330.1 hypothetical protein K450DRAFT_228492 [Umbelopsis ramanniana AG]